MSHSKTERGRATRRRIGRKWDLLNKHKRWTHKIVSMALRDGRLRRPSACETCGALARLQAHHDDYDKPLSVRWLCHRCHYAWHREHGPGALPAAPYEARATYLEHDGVRLRLFEWAKRIGVTTSALCTRLTKMSPAEALTMPRRYRPGSRGEPVVQQNEVSAT